MFAACHEALAEGAHIALYPEGGVHREPRMIPLKTGTARIALGAAADDGVRGIEIVPIGLVYDDKARFRSQVAIHIGQGIDVDEWVERYRARVLKADQLLYVVGAPQRLHFELVFAAARMAGWLTVGEALGGLRGHVGVGHSLVRE